jgi:cell wall-associated NlpC family hydrolase
MTGRRTGLTRLAAAVLLVVPLVVLGSPGSSGAVTKTSQAEVQQAKDKLDALNRQLEVISEDYNAAQVRLGIAQQKLQAARVAMKTAQAQADDARAALAQRAVDAYTNAGSQLNFLLGAQSFSDFSDQLEFMGTIAQNDADLATKAQAAGQQAKWAAQQFTAAVAERRSEAAQVAAKKSEIQKLVSRQSADYRRTSANRADYLAFLKAQKEAFQQSQSSGGTAPDNYVPPPNATAVEIAIGAEKSVLGVRDVYSSADPSVGFDCSGLQMWAWAHAGVYLPHSAAMQYDALPHVPLDQIQPGDLLFFYSPITHVAMYLGDGLIIHATHPGPGGQVHIEPLGSIWTPLLTGAARPG